MTGKEQNGLIQWVFFLNQGFGLEVGRGQVCCGEECL